MNWTPITKGFKAYLQLERSLSKNSVENYLRDVQKLVDFLEIHQLDLSIQEISVDHLIQFVQWINEIGLGANSQARIISGIKTFYKFLLIEDIVDTNPMQRLDSPKLKRKIPAVLSYTEIQAMLATIDLSQAHGLRNRAMLETLYASGLRVSELINMRISHFYPQVAYIKVIGKNDKERIVAIVNTVARNEQCSTLENDTVAVTLRLHVAQDDVYIFKFWQGKDTDGENQFLVNEVPVITSQ